MLHISNDFPNSDLYEQLILHLDQLGIKQTVYSAVRTEREVRYNPSQLSNINLKIHNILYTHDRLLFRLKIRKIYRDVVRRIELQNINFVHAHTLYSDGAVALKIKKDFGIPYVVTVRNTALNAFDKFRPDLKWRRNKILLEAEKIIFLSPAYRNKLTSRISHRMQKEIEQKMIAIPNGIDSVFLHINTPKEDSNSTLRILYVGRFLKLKNIFYLIKAVDKLNKSINITLTLVGGGGDDQERIQEMVSLRPFVKYLGVVKNKDKLRKIYQVHDIFVMVSKPETFGLVYIEALSQGLPVIHTQGEGIDGYFEEGTVAEVVNNPQDVDEIANKIERLANRLDKELKEKCIIVSKRFNWSEIANQYKSIYLQKY